MAIERRKQGDIGAPRWGAWARGRIITPPRPARRREGAEGLANVVTLSTFRDKQFRRDYGVEITSGKLVGLAARSVVVLDENDKVIHSELVPEIAQDPNYDAALAALK